MASEVIIAGKRLVCPHCGGWFFNDRESQLNTSAMTFFNLDWMNASATVYVCDHCRRLEWFLEPEANNPNLESRDCPRCGTWIDSGSANCPNCKSK